LEEAFKAAAELPPSSVSVTSSTHLRGRTKILHLVRHGHGFHNEAGEIDYENYKLEEFEDAELTPHGLGQCASLSQLALDSLSMRRVDALVVSPMRRALQTAQFSFPGLINKVPWTALESLREQTGLHPCDRRLSKTSLSSANPHVDFSFVTSELDPLYPLYPASREPSEQVNARVKSFLGWVFASNHTEVVVVTHSVFICHLLGVLGHSPDHFQNCEMRSYAISGEYKEDA
jgi:broad specificity phosphatase PhoE